MGVAVTSDEPKQFPLLSITIVVELVHDPLETMVITEAESSALIFIPPSNSALVIDDGVITPTLDES